MKRICVFCGSRMGAGDDYCDVAVRLGRAIAGRGLGLVYGGGDTGLMGAVAQAALDGGAEVIGIIPQGLVDREIAFRAIGELRIVGSMHARKAQMADLADAFITLPGGFGTLDETFEILTWAQVGFHAKPVGLLNVAGFYDGLLTFLEHACAEDLLRAEHLAIPMVAADPEALLDRLLASEAPPHTSKWEDIR